MAVPLNICPTSILSGTVFFVQEYPRHYRVFNILAPTHEMTAVGQSFKQSVTSQKCPLRELDYPRLRTTALMEVSRKNFDVLMCQNIDVLAPSCNFWQSSVEKLRLGYTQQWSKQLWKGDSVCGWMQKMEGLQDCLPWEG